MDKTKMMLRKLFSKEPSIESLQENQDIDGLIEIINKDKFAKYQPGAIVALGQLCNSVKYGANNNISALGKRIIECLVAQLYGFDRNKKQITIETLKKLEVASHKLAVIEIVQNKPGLNNELLEILSEYVKDQRIKKDAIKAFSNLDVTHWQTKYSAPLIDAISIGDDFSDNATKVLCELIGKFASKPYRGYWKPAYGKIFLGAIPNFSDEYKIMIIECFGDHVVSWDFARNVISSLFQDNNKKTRLAAIEAYGKVFDKLATFNGSPLVNLLNEQDEDILLTAINQLRKSTLEMAIEPLSILSKSRDKEISSNAKLALEEIKSRRAKFEEGIRSIPKETIKSIQEAGRKAVQDSIKEEYEEMKREYESDGSGQSPYHDT